MIFTFILSVKFNGNWGWLGKTQAVYEKKSPWELILKLKEAAICSKGQYFKNSWISFYLFICKG